MPMLFKKNNIIIRMEESDTLHPQNINHTHEVPDKQQVFTKLPPVNQDLSIMVNISNDQSEKKLKKKKKRKLKQQVTSSVMEKDENQCNAVDKLHQTWQQHKKQDPKVKDLPFLLENTSSNKPVLHGHHISFSSNCQI